MQNLLHSKILGKGQPLLILHGFLGSGDNWITLGRQFAKDFEVHLIDLRNHGRSFHDKEMDYKVMCQDIFHYCEHYHLDNIYLLGHSMGGKVAMHLAVHHPELVNKLIVADIAPKEYPHRHQVILDALQAVDFLVVQSRDDIEAVLAQYIDNKAIRQFLMKNIKRIDQTTFAYKCNLPVLVSHYELMNESIPPLSQYEGEALFIKGALSDYILTSDKARIEVHFPKAQIKIIQKTGHWLHAEQPDKFYHLIMEFLTE